MNPFGVIQNKKAKKKGTEPLVNESDSVKLMASVLEPYKHLDWVKRLYEQNTPSIMLEGEEYPSTHMMADDGKGYVFPMIQMINGKLTFLGNDAEDYARKTNTGIQFKDVKTGSMFAANGYKRIPGVLPNR